MIQNVSLDSKMRVALLLAIALLVTIRGLGQQTSATAMFVNCNTFTSEHGLSQNNVSCIIKDRDGFIWLGTGDGLNRFDGYSFIQFTHSDADTTSISNDVIRNFLVDSDGRLWVGTYNGLNLYDSEKEAFQPFLTRPGDEHTISQNTIVSIIEDRNHHLWVGTYRGLNKINLQTFEVVRYLYKPDGTGLADNDINALLEDRHGRIWACTGKGISILGPKGVEETIPQSDAPDGLPSELIVEIVQDSTGAIYLGSNGSGVLRLANESDRTFEHFRHTLKGPSVGNNIIAALAIDRHGVLLVGTDGAGLYRHEGEGKFTQIMGRESRVLNNGHIQKVFADEKNNYWIGLFGSGLAFIPGDPPLFEHYRFFDLTMERIGKNSVLDIVEDRNQKIWIGTDGAGLYKFDPETKRFTPYQHSPTDKNSLSTNVVKSLLVDHENNLYIGTYAGGLNYLETKTNTFSRYLHNPNDPASISTNHVWSLLQGRNHRIYVGQLGGLNEFLPESKTFKVLPISGGNSITNQTASVFSMREDLEGNIWMGTRLAGVHRYDPTSGSFTSFVNIAGDSLSLPTNEILELELDSNGKLLIGTDNKGLLRLDPETFRFTQLIPEFREKNIPSILEDDSHTLWFTSFDGLHKYDPATGQIYSYIVADGLQGVQFNEGARLKSSTGEFYFGGTNGLNIFHPEKVLEDESKPSVVFTALSLFHDVVRINDQTKLLTKSITKSTSITFQPDQNVFSLEFACLEYRFPKKNRYRYYLEGFDNDWNEVTKSRMATYTNLPPGEYTLNVGVTNGNRPWDDKAASIHIVVMPRWYQRLDTRIGAAILLLLFTVAIIHVRTNFLLKQKRKLEHLVTVRTQLVETQKEEIKNKNKELNMAYEEVNTANEQLNGVNATLEKLVEKRTGELQATIKKLIETDEGLKTFLYRSSHDLRGPITTLLGLAGLAKIQNHQGELDAYFFNMENTASGMIRLLGRLNDTAALFRSRRRLKNIQVDKLVRSIKSQLNDLNIDHLVRIEFENRAGDSFTSDRVLLSHIIVNLMENSIVFRGQNRPFAKCVLSLEDQRLIVQVMDNGIGISPAIRDRIFDMFYRGSEKSKGNGLGLFMVKKALELLEGSIDIQSEPDVLTVVTITIPVRHTTAPPVTSKPLVK
jgi:ligand-binding sensor domain-containing protein/signal transduction histidine kinase